jgi:hypothetical protein
MTTHWMWLLLTSAQAATLDFSGDCRGELTLEAVGLSPDRAFQFLWGREGHDTVPFGVCAGTELGVSADGWTPTMVADPEGAAAIDFTLRWSLCGKAVQVLDLATCEATNVVVLPGATSPIDPLWEAVETLSAAVEALASTDAALGAELDALQTTLEDLEVAAPGEPVDDGRIGALESAVAALETNDEAQEILLDTLEAEVAANTIDLVETMASVEGLAAGLPAVMPFTYNPIAGVISFVDADGIPHTLTYATDEEDVQVDDDMHVAVKGNTLYLNIKSAPGVACTLLHDDDDAIRYPSIEYAYATDTGNVLAAPWGDEPTFMLQQVGTGGTLLYPWAGFAVLCY